MSALNDLTSKHLPEILLIPTILLSLYLLRRPKHSHLPPSPPGDPIIGHARVMSLERAWETFASWREKYGDIIYLNVFGSPKIIINSASAARELLDKRGATFSDRPREVVVGELMGWSLSLPFLPYGDRFRRQRRLIQRYFDPQAIAMFRPIQTERVHAFLGELLQGPEDLRHATHRLLASTILKTTYGYTVLHSNDPLIELVDRATSMSSGEVGSVATTSIELFPFLRHVPVWFPSWFPGVWIKRLALRAGEVVEEVKSRPLRELKERKAAGVTDPSFVSKMLDDFEAEARENPEIPEDIKNLGGMAYAAGFHTSASTLLTIILAMVRHPEAAKKAQAEIDRVTGGDRLPTLDDRADIPYIDCIIKETFRINPPLPLSLSHKTTQTEQYREWTIPKGAEVMPNLWAMMQDEKYFPDPEAFLPERYLDIVKGSTGTGDWPRRDNDPGTLVFGFGRRICPGRFFAEKTIWLASACLLATFDLSPYVDATTGQEIMPEFAFFGTTSEPRPFKCTVTPRSEKHAGLVSDVQGSAIE